MKNLKASPGRKGVGGSSVVGRSSLVVGRASLKCLDAVGELTASAGSFECASASLREDDAPLRMTDLFWTVLFRAVLFCRAASFRTWWRSGIRASKKAIS